MSSHHATARTSMRAGGGPGPSTAATSRRQRRILLLALAFGAIPASLWAGDAPTVIRVEEDWVLEIGVPDPEGNAPQVTITLAPWGRLEHLHAVFELNHQNMPAYADGGMQLQTWYGEYPFSYHNSPNGNVLSTEDETVSFTSSMAISSGRVLFEIKNGASQTWGNFGGEGNLKGAAYTLLNNLNSYSPAASVKYAKVGFAAHRVKKLALKEVRYYSSSGLIATDSTERIVHEHAAGG